MYQTEDLLRAYHFDIEEIEKFVISHLPVEDIEKRDFKNWYAEINVEMQSEGITKQGHLERVQKIVTELTDLHESLLVDDTEYAEVYANSEPNISRFMSLSGGKVDNPVQVCLNGVYGMLLLRMNGKKIDDETKTTLDTFGDVLSYLSFKYQQGNIISDN